MIDKISNQPIQTAESGSEITSDTPKMVSDEQTTPILVPGPLFQRKAVLEDVSKTEFSLPAQNTILTPVFINEQSEPLLEENVSNGSQKFSSIESEYDDLSFKGPLYLKELALNAFLLLYKRDSYNCLWDIIGNNQELMTVSCKGKSLLRTALDLGRIRAAKALIDRGADIHEGSEEGYQLSLSFWAIRQQKPAFLKLFFHHMTPYEVSQYRQMRYPGGETLLHIAARYGNKEIIDFLIEKEFNPNIQNENGDTPLHFAASTNDIKLVSAFFKKKIPLRTDPSIRNVHREFPENMSLNFQIRRYLYRQRYQYILSRKMLSLSERRYEWLTKESLRRASFLFKCKEKEGRE